MAGVRITNWLQSAFHLSALGQTTELTFNWRSITSGNWTESDLAILNNNLWTYLGTELRSLIVDDAQFIDLTTTDMNPTGTAQSTLPFSAVFGSAPGEIAPLNVCNVISWRSGIRGRNARGRVYIGPVTESDVLNGVFTTTFMGLATGFANKYLSFSNSGGRNVHPAMASRTAGVVRDLFSAVITSIPDSQRRRLQGRGR